LRVDAHDDFVAVTYWLSALKDAPNAKIRAVCECSLWRTKKNIAGRASRDYQAAHGKTPPKSAQDLRDPKLMSPSVYDYVLDGLELDAAGVPHYAKLAELERVLVTFRAEDYCAQFREDNGRPPTEKEFYDGFGKPPPTPKGKRWKFADSKLSLVDD
jgi:hypothetical protein